MYREENFVGVADSSGCQARFRVPPLTPLLAPMRSPSISENPAVQAVSRVELDKAKEKV
jgi:hypothetical protein